MVEFLRICVHERLVAPLLLGTPGDLVAVGVEAA